MLRVREAGIETTAMTSGQTIQLAAPSGESGTQFFRISLLPTTNKATLAAVGGTPASGTTMAIAAGVETHLPDVYHRDDMPYIFAGGTLNVTVRYRAVIGTL